MNARTRHRARAVSVLVLAVVPALAVAALGAAPAGATFPGTNGRIAYGSTGNQVTVVNPDGSGAQNVASGGSPSWSPDGSKIAFVSPSLDIVVINADGSGARNLTNNQNGSPQALYPSWSPDGTMIVFAQRPNSSSKNQIWVMNADGSNRHQLTNNGNQDQYPSWSPDGKTIAFESDRNSQTPEMFIMNADGTNQHQVTGTQTPVGALGRLDWAPDGSKIVFSDAAANLETVKPDGSGLTKLTSQGTDFDPAFSPDGTKLVFQRTVNQQQHTIVTANADGSGVAQVGSATGTEPSWGKPAAVSPTTTTTVVPPQPTVPAQAALSLSSSTVAAGAQLGVSGSGFSPNQTVDLTLYSAPTAIGSVPTDASGTFSTVVAIPASTAPGAHTLVATTRNGGPQGSAALNVTAAAGSASTPSSTPAATGALAATGSGRHVERLVLTALTLLVAGALVMFSTRRWSAPAHERP